MLLCSLLLGAGYDAYVVSGYATQDVCLADEARQVCPFLQKKEEVGLFCAFEFNIKFPSFGLNRRVNSLGWQHLKDKLLNFIVNI